MSALHTRVAALRASALFRDGAWTLVFNLLTKSQALGIVASGALIGGVIDVGRLSAAVAATTLGAGLADFGYSYESGRRLAADPFNEVARRIARQVPARMLIGGVLTIVAFYLTLGHQAARDPVLYLAIFLTGAMITCSQILMQLLNALNKFKGTATAFGGIRFASALLSVGLAWITRNTDVVLCVLAGAELVSAVVLSLQFAASLSVLAHTRRVVATGRGYLWLGIGSTFNSLVNRSDVLLVAAITNPTALGIYSIASQLENSIESLALAPAGPLTIYVARARASGRVITDYVSQTLRTTIRLGLVASIAVAVAYLIFVTVPLPHGSLSITSAGYPIIICIFSAIFVAVAGVYFGALVGYREYAQVSRIRIVNGIAAICAFLLLTPSFGAAGAATAAAIRDGSLLLLALLGARRLMSKAGDAITLDSVTTLESFTSDVVENGQHESTS